MKKIYRMLLGVSLAVVFCGITSNAQTIDPVTQAALSGYEQLLKENPNDYMTLYQRAAQYYMMHRYDDALVDLRRALKCTPSSDSEMRAGEYALISDVYAEQEDYKQALTAIDSALNLQSADYLMLFRKAEICLKLGKWEEAYKSFARMRNINARSQEAYFGMAQADLMMKHEDEASELIREGMSLGKTNYQTYLRIGNLYKNAGVYYDAAVYYLKAFDIDSGKAEILQQLAELSKIDYQAVEQAFNSSIQQSTNSEGLYYLLGRLSLSSGHYIQADNCFSMLMRQGDVASSSVAAGAAEACFYRGKLKDALVFINNALSRDSRPDYYAVKGMIEIGLGNASEAVTSASEAIKLGGNESFPKIVLAEAYILARDGKEALAVLNDIITADPSDIKALMLRAYVNFELLNDGKAAIADYSRIAKSGESASFYDSCLQALAMSLSGQLEQGNALIKELVKKNESHKRADNYFYVAVYYAQTGNLEEAQKMANEAIRYGYENLYELNIDKIANLTIAPIRHLLR